MARPRKDNGGKSALERLEDAYWLLLEREGYAGMTISALSRTAGVNHNTFYHYFDNLEDMSCKLFQRNLLWEFGQTILEVALGEGEVELGGLLASGEFLPRFNRIRLMAGSGCPLLESLLREQLVGAWISFFDVEFDALDFEDRVDLTYISYGVVGMIGNLPKNVDPKEILPIFHRELGKGIVGTFRRLIGKYGVTDPDVWKCYFFEHGYFEKIREMFPECECASPML